jgi:outer membrane protein OmpA-like peptidoglycan-associated protein
MPNGTTQPALAVVAMIAVSLLQAGCAIPPRAGLSRLAVVNQAPAVTDDAQFARLASDISTDVPTTQLLSAAPGTCGPTAAPVVHFVVPEPVLFATASDQPGANAAAALNEIAALVMQDSPASVVTVLGHTDALGSDAYNMDLSKRRAETVLRALAADGIDPDRLSAVAIGKRQPIADDATPEGRQQNRRVEFLISRCLAANLGVVAAVAPARLQPGPDTRQSRAAEVLRLQPGGGYGLAPLATIELRPADDKPPNPVQVSSPTAAAAAPLPSVRVAQPAPPPHYLPRTPSPDVQPNRLGSAVPF